MTKESGLLTAAFLAATLGLGIRAYQAIPAGSGLEGQKSSHAQSTSQRVVPSFPLNPELVALEKGPCSDLELHLQAFFGGSDQIAAPASCYADGLFHPAPLKAETVNLKIVIAILPDPLHTYLSLTFDRYAVALQQAAQDERYTYDSSWFPWETESFNSQSLADKLTADRATEQREDQPGIILFRKSPDDNPTSSPQDIYGKGLAILIVGEEATGGIHRKQFQNALQWFDLLKKDNTEALWIVGPSFTGSLPSLSQLIEATKGDVNVMSGSITGDRGIKELVDREDKNPNHKFFFRSFQQSSNSQIESYCRFLKDAGMEVNGRIAIISEDETAYGDIERPSQDAQKPRKHYRECGTPEDMNATILYYPRDISALRAAYQDQSLFSPASPGNEEDVVRRSLKNDIADPEGNQHDTIRSYSGSQTALSQESELQQIVLMLKTHQSQYVIVRSSDPLDQIFLTHYLQQHYPEGRIVIQGADLLLARDLDASGISGVMTLSNYPLIPDEQDWTVLADGTGQLPPHSHRAFTNGDAEGTYIAARIMLRPPPDLCADIRSSSECKVETHPPPENFPRDYSPPFWVDHAKEDEYQSPSTWIGVLGHGGFWPVAAMDKLDDEQNEGTNWGAWRDSVFFVDYLRKTYSRTERMGRGINPPLTMRLVLAILFLWAGFHLWCCVYPSITQKPGFFAHFAAAPFSLDRRSLHRGLIVTGSVLIGIVATVVGWGMGTHSVAGDVPIVPYGYRIAVILLWLIGLASVSINAWMEVHLQSAAVAGSNTPIPWTQGITEVWRVFCYYFLATFGFHVLIICLLEPSLHEYNRIPTYLRSMNVTSGVSPIAPVLILVAGLYFWVWFTLQGQALIGEDRPLLPKRRSLQVTTAGGTSKENLLTMLSREDVAEPIERWCDWWSSYTNKSFGIIFVTLCIVSFTAIGCPPIRSLGDRRFSYFCFFCIVLCASILLTNIWQLLRIWLKLRQLLATLDRLPLRRTIAALKGFSWRSIWDMGGNVLDQRYRLYSRQAESLNHLRKSLTDVHQNSFEEIEVFSAQVNLARLNNLTTPRLKLWRWYAANWNDWRARDAKLVQRKLQTAFASIAGYALVKILVPAWQNEENSLIANSSVEPHKTGSISLADLPRHIQATEEFVCLVYLGFVHNVLGRIRSFVSGIIFLFVPLAIGMSSYPFDPRPILSGFTVTLFLILGYFIFMVYSQMYRDACLSLLTDTNPGELGADFWLKLTGFAVGPVFGLLASIFPAFANIFFSWMQPNLK